LRSTRVWEEARLIALYIRTGAFTSPNEIAPDQIERGMLPPSVVAPEVTGHGQARARQRPSEPLTTIAAVLRGEAPHAAEVPEGTDQGLRELAEQLNSAKAARASSARFQLSGRP
jgi:hypothetical protein